MGDSTIDINYRPGPISKAFHADAQSRAKLLIGPFGTGKTTSAAWDIIDFAADRIRPTNNIKRSRFAVVRNTLPQLRETTTATYLNWFPPAFFGTHAISKRQYIIKFEGKEVELLFKALDSPEDVQDLLSLELTGAHIDEAREIHEDVFKGLLGRIGRYPAVKDGINPYITPPQVILTTNYPSSEHWLYRDFVSDPVDGYAIYRQTQAENSHNLRPGYYEDLEHDYANRPDLLRTLVRGEWGVTIKGRQVYPEFRRELHISKVALEPLDAPVIRGWDNTGLSPACIVMQINATGQVYVLKEFIADDEPGIIDFGTSVQLWCNQTFGAQTKYRDIGDPAGNNRDSNKMSPAMYLAQLGIKIEDGIQTFKARRESVASRLTKLVNGAPAILINPSCRRLIDGFEGGYAYGEVGNTGTFKTEPAKNEYSHIHDALQYPCTRLFIKEPTPAVKPYVAPPVEGSWLGV